jgi:rhodanese-related sulfurtransferase
MRRLFWIAISGFLLCGAARNLSIHNVPPKDAERLLAEGGVLILDVRTPKEFQGGHLPNAKLMPVQEISRRLSELPTDKTQPILVYCGTGIRSSKAAHILYRNGYKDIYNMAGGLHAWIASQKPIQIPPPQ